MTEARPQIEAGGCTECAKSGEVLMPTQSVPAGGGSAMVTAAPAGVTGVTGVAAPSLTVTGEAIAGISVWQNNKRIVALWSINQNRNAHVGVDGIGWRKLANNSDSAIMALNMLASHAREKGSIVNYREEDVNGTIMIQEMYVW